MAYDKPLKIQWTEINGRTVPLVLPQYWSDEQNDWVVSSEQNRLPVDAQLTGSIVEKVIEVEGASTGTGSVQVYWGKNFGFGASGEVLDVSHIKNIIILLENMGNEQTGSGGQLTLYTEKYGNAEGKNSPDYIKRVNVPRIEAGAKLLITKNDYPDLEMPIPGLTYRYWNNTSTTVKMTVIGSR